MAVVWLDGRSITIWRHRDSEDNWTFHTHLAHDIVSVWTSPWWCIIRAWSRIRYMEVYNSVRPKHVLFLLRKDVSNGADADSHCLGFIDYLATFCLGAVSRLPYLRPDFDQFNVAPL